MLAAALRLFLLLELLVYGLVANRLFELSPGMASLSAVGILLGQRAGIIAVTYLFAIAHHSPAPRLGVVRALAMFIAEYAAFLFLFLLVQPFERLWMGSDRLPPGRPVLLMVHGYGCNRGVWWWYRRHLERAGYGVATLSLEPIHTSIDDYVGALDARIEAVCREAGCSQLTLVGHSMGGLVARAYLAVHGARRVTQLVTIATPHAGTEPARTGLGTNARQMEVGSPWLKALWQSLPALPVATLRNAHDNFVMPQDSQRLPGAEDVELPALGHLAVLFSPRACDALRERLIERP